MGGGGTTTFWISLHQTWVSILWSWQHNWGESWKCLRVGTENCLGVWGGSAKCLPSWNIWTPSTVAIISGLCWIVRLHYYGFILVIPTLHLALPSIYDGGLDVHLTTFTICPTTFDLIIILWNYHFTLIVYITILYYSYLSYYRILVHCYVFIYVLFISTFWVLSILMFTGITLLYFSTGYMRLP